uniref:Uncharacterized protein n=1 Tax=Timema poppense TaxID=170557 RepID=A0A7R9DBZ6_TIMPO|nr:unnamed protein product [Timema poppensis]
MGRSRIGNWPIPFELRSLSPSSAVSAETINLSTTASRTNSLPRPTSPSPSVVSEKAEAELQDKQEREEEERKRKIQLYVFISRCIAYPFNAKQPTDMTRRQTKITKQQLETIQGRFQIYPDLGQIRARSRADLANSSSGPDLAFFHMVP